MPRPLEPLDPYASWPALFAPAVQQLRLRLRARPVVSQDELGKRIGFVGSLRSARSSALCCGPTRSSWRAVSGSWRRRACSVPCSHSWSLSGGLRAAGYHPTESRWPAVDPFGRAWARGRGCDQSRPAAEHLTSRPPRGDAGSGPGGGALPGDDGFEIAGRAVPGRDRACARRQVGTCALPLAVRTAASPGLSRSISSACSHCAALQTE